MVPDQPGSSPGGDQQDPDRTDATQATNGADGADGADGAGSHRPADPVGSDRPAELPTGGISSTPENPAFTEQYANTSPRITGGVIIAVIALVVLDVLWEWRTLDGFAVILIMLAVGTVSYLGLIRPAVLLGPSALLIRNHLRDHLVPWGHVGEAEVTDVLRVQVDGRWIRCPGIQLILRDIRKELRRGGSKPTGRENTKSYSSTVVQRIEHHVERYAAGATGPVRSTWRTGELIVLGVAAGGAALLVWL